MMRKGGVKNSYTKQALLEIFQNRSQISQEFKQLIQENTDCFIKISKNPENNEPNTMNPNDNFVILGKFDKPENNNNNKDKGFKRNTGPVPQKQIPQQKKLVNIFDHFSEGSVQREWYYYNINYQKEGEELKIAGPYDAPFMYKLYAQNKIQPQNTKVAFKTKEKFVKLEKLIKIAEKAEEEKQAKIIEVEKENQALKQRLENVEKQEKINREKQEKEIQEIKKKAENDLEKQKQVVNKKEREIQKKQKEINILQQTNFQQPKSDQSSDENEQEEQKKQEKPVFQEKKDDFPTIGQQKQKQEEVENQENEDQDDQDQDWNTLPEKQVNPKNLSKKAKRKLKYEQNQKLLREQEEEKQREIEAEKERRIKEKQKREQEKKEEQERIQREKEEKEKSFPSLQQEKEKPVFEPWNQNPNLKRVAKPVKSSDIDLSSKDDFPTL